MIDSRPTSRTSEPAAPVSGIECICISYPGCTFLLNRAQVTGSCYDGQGDSVKTGSGPLRLIETGDGTYPLVSLDDFAARHFRVPVSKPAEMILFVRGDSPGVPRIPRIRKKSSGEIVDTGIIAVQLSGRTSLKSVSLEDLRLFPPGIFPALSRCGFLGVSFPGGDSVEYLVDMQALIVRKIIKPLNAQVSNEDNDR